MPTAPARRSAGALLALLVLLVVVGAPPSPAGAADPDDAALLPPVDAPVVDPFRRPEHPWGAGNRGLEYATVPGTVVRAPGDGVVTFAGRVVRALHVTVLHPDGLRSTVSLLDSVDVVAGQHVRRGEPLGRSGPRLHLGIRAGEEYLDPAAVLAGARPRARLVADDLLAVDPAAAARAEAAVLAELEGMLGGAGVVEVIGSLLPDVQVLLDAYDALAPERWVQRVLLDLVDWHLRQRSCTAGEVRPAPPPERRVAVLVAGLASTSDQAGIDALDTGALGYAEGDVLRFSYRGGRVPGAHADGVLGTLPAHPYGAADTQGDLRAAGVRLLELLAAVAAADPGVPIDVYAHSQGGIVARLALADPSLPTQVGTLVTIASPHQGADLATLLARVRAKPGADLVLGALGPVHGLEPTATAPAQLAERSDLLRSLGAPPDHVRTLSIAARGDPVVAVGATRLAGAEHVVVPTAGPGAHQSVVRAPQTTRAIALALADLPPGCETLTDALADSLTGQAVAGISSALAGALELPRVPRPGSDRPDGDP